MMQNHTGHFSMDPVFQALRINMQEKICKWFERKYTNRSIEWKQRLPEIAKMLEESIYKESLNKDDYMSKFQSGIESRIISMQNQLNQKRQQQQQSQQQQLSQQQNQHQTMAHHNIQSNSSVSGMMIPMPGISHNPTGTMRMPSSMESNQGINPTSDPAGTMSNGYQLSHGSMSINQLGSTSMSASIGVQRQVTPQMIRTPGFNSISTTQVTQQTMPMNSDYNNGSGMQPQKQQQYNTLSGQVGPGHFSMDPVFQALRINMQEKICKWFERKYTNRSSEWKQRLPDIAKMLEESIYKESLNKDDYMSKFQSGIESRIISMQNQLNQKRQRQQQQQSQQQNQHQTMAHHNIQSNSLVSGMMIPMPGISHNPTGKLQEAPDIEMTDEASHSFK